MRDVLLVTLSVLWVVTPLVGQRALMRIERAQAGELLCALVNEDGSYRLEKMFRSKNEIYAGSLEAERLDQLHHLLGDETLAKLSQSDIHSPLISDTFDNLLLAIHRSSRWQELSFLSPDSRKPYKDSIDPLLRWFQDLQKQKPAAARLAEPPSRCMPSAEKKTEIVSAPNAPAPAVPPGGASFYFRIETSHFYRGHIDSSCTMVASDGGFRYERGGQSYGADRHDKIMEGQVSPAALQELRGILDRQELKDSPGSPVNEPQWSIEGDWALLQIPRENKLQNLAFETTFNTLNRPSQAGGQSNLNYHVADKRLLDPLKHWMKENTEKGTRESTGVGNNCVLK